MKRSLGMMAAAAALAMAANGSAFAGPGDPVKVIYHINQGNQQATDGLRNASNHLKADPKAKIVFVAHSKGIRFLLDGAKDANNSPYDAIVQDLAGKGVEFRLCAFTLERGKIDIAQPDVTMVGGLTELMRISDLAQRRGKRLVTHGYKSNITIAANLAFLSQHWMDEPCEYSTSQSPLRGAIRPPGQARGVELVPDAEFRFPVGTSKMRPNSALAPGAFQ